LSEFEAIYGFKGDTNLAHVQAPLVQAGDILHPQTEDYGGLRPIVVPVGVDQDPHLRLTRGLASKTNWFNLKPGKSAGLTVALSVQESNAAAFGQQPDGRVDRGVRQAVFDRIVERLSALGFSDLRPNPKHGTVDVPSASKRDLASVRLALLGLERELGGMGLMAPSSTYHHFAVGLDGDKMSSSRPDTTIFLGDEPAKVAKKIKRAFSGGQPTVEEHRRLGGDPDRDVAFQYMAYFFEEDDVVLADLAESYRAGRLLAGEMKQACLERAEVWLGDLAERRDETAHLVETFLAPDAR
jgi:tryptophanyl-tRNA synthetase